VSQVSIVVVPELVEVNEPEPVKVNEPEQKVDEVQEVEEVKDEPEAKPEIDLNPLAKTLPTTPPLHIHQQKGMLHLRVVQAEITRDKAWFNMTPYFQVHYFSVASQTTTEQSFKTSVGKSKTPYYSE